MAVPKMRYLKYITTRQDTLRDDLQAMDISWEEAKSVASSRPVFQWEQEDLSRSKTSYKKVSVPNV